MREGDQQRFDTEGPSEVVAVPSEQATEGIRWRELAVTFPVLLLFSWLGIVLSRQSEGVATIWLTNGMLFAVVITRPRRVWWLYFGIGLLADTLADVLYGDPFRLAIGVSLANS